MRANDQAHRYYRYDNVHTSMLQKISLKLSFSSTKWPSSSIMQRLFKNVMCFKNIQWIKVLHTQTMS